LGFRQFQSLDLSQGGIRADNPAMQRALASIAGLLNRPVPPVAPLREGPAFARRTALIGGAGTVLAGAAGWGLWSRLQGIGGPGNSPDNSIAVLPFDNLSRDSAQQYLTDGLAAEVRARLARNPLLKVMGQVTSKGARNGAAPAEDSPTAIAGRLGVANLLNGNVRVADGHIRVAVDLIDGRTGFTRWSQSYDQPLDNVLQLQAGIAEAVTTALTPALAGGGTETLVRSGGTRAAAAFDAYLRGKEAFDAQFNDDSDRRALALFGQAVAIDPNYAAARAARSLTLVVIANQARSAAERERFYAEAVAEARQAVASAAEFGDGYAALGNALFYGQLDVAGAAPAYDKARQFAAGNPEVLGRYALYCARRRQFDKAVPAIEAAQTLDPLNPTVFKYLGLVRFAQGDGQRAVAAARRALEINPKRASIHGDIGNALLVMGQFDAASAEFTAEPMIDLAATGQAIIALKRGDQATAQRNLDRLVSEMGDNSSYQQAQILAQWGKSAQALDALDRAMASHDAGLVYLYVDPFLAPIRSEPRYSALLTHLHFL
jgi:TolB-like protein/tetratricopeptide (TPR) repeat protein